MSLAYVICTSPRSGSTLLCDGLTRTGRAGKPAEYFDDRPEVGRHWASRLAISDSEPYADQIVDATSTPNGVFGTKLHWTTRLAMHRSFRATSVAVAKHPVRPTLDDLLRMRFSAVRYIWLRRRNKVAQGISHFRAERSGLWELPSGACRDSVGGHEPVEFDLRFIDHCITWAARYDVEWEDYFSRHRLDPVVVFYEDLIASYDASLRNVLDFIGVSHGDLAELVPHLERMADEDSLAWEGRYRELEATMDRGATRPIGNKGLRRP